MALLYLVFWYLLDVFTYKKLTIYMKSLHQFYLPIFNFWKIIFEMIEFTLKCLFIKTIMSFSNVRNKSDSDKSKLLKSSMFVAIPWSPNWVFTKRIAGLNLIHIWIDVAVSELPSDLRQGSCQPRRRDGSGHWRVHCTRLRQLLLPGEHFKLLIFNMKQ